MALAACAVAVAAPASALAQASRTWVSGVGDDANPCSRTAPCKTFAGAISKTQAGGEIDALDPAGFGALTITKSITINAEGVTAGVLVSGTSGIVVEAGPNDHVTLRGLDFDGLGTSLNGVQVISGGHVRIERSQIYGFNNGIDFEPNSNSRLVVEDTVVHDNTGVGLYDHPASAVFGYTTLRRDSFDDNGSGIFAHAGAGGYPRINSFRTSIADNSGAGVRAYGASAIIRISENDVTGNANGLLAQSGGSILSWGNNFVYSNTTDGSPTGHIAPV